MKHKLKVGIFGFGCVGQGLYHVLNETHGVKAEIKRICVRDHNKPRPIGPEIFTFNPDDILKDPDIDVVVELIDRTDDAYRITHEAMKNGKHVVSANKRMIAQHLPEIVAWQTKYNRSFLYEGSVCGSIPIIRNLEEYYDNDLLRSIEGIFNGSTNYILTKVVDEKKSYAEALLQAQQKGFAESDPSQDVKAFDPKYKLIIVIAHTFGVFLEPERVINIGIDKLSAADLAYALKNNWRIKLVAHAARMDSDLFGFVIPQYITEHHSFASVHNEYNAVSVEGAFSEKQLFVGKGAGGYPTGAAVLSDISALAYEYRYEYKKAEQEDRYTFTNDVIVDAVISFENGKIKPSDFETVKVSTIEHDRHFIEGAVRLLKLKEWSELDNVSIVLAPDCVVRKGK